ncbi:MAG: T9SS type A sorting domain-containing protein [Calditrichaeota bacterium]|nr:T9SS type A sorting domain-containing protein [Calditrichota bacterium]MCB9369683.1 T9SS type A sorting domain-containing protein [Calditrichota bacterium]
MYRSIFATIVCAICLLSETGLGQNVVALGSYPLSEYSNDIEIGGAYAFLAYGENGLLILDASDPANIVEAGSLEFNAECRDIVLLDTLAYVICDDGIHVIDISNVQEPVEVGFDSLDNDYGAEGVFYDHYFVAGTPGGIHVYDIADPLNPSEVSQLELECCLGGIALSDHYIVVAQLWFYSGIRVVNIEDPLNPEVVGEATANDWGHGVTVVGDFAAVAVDMAGMQVFDISQPSSPELISTMPLNSFSITNSISSSGNYVFVTGQSEWLYVLNLENGSEPISVGRSLETLDGTEVAVSLNGQYAYTADNRRFQVFDCSAALPVENDRSALLPTEISLQAYPNPFNPSTSLSFELPKDVDVTLSVFDIQGRLVDEIVNGHLAAGAHTVNWSCAECASGVYLAAMKAGSFSATRKLLLLK